MKFLGSDQKIIPIREQLAENTELWDEEEPLLTNLERVLDLEFPSRDTQESQSQAAAVECGICMEEAMEGQGCEDEKCDGTFHPACLYQWLLRANTRRAFSGVLTGRCPNCQKPIMCSKPAE